MVSSIQCLPQGGRFCHRQFNAIPCLNTTCNTEERRLHPFEITLAGRSFAPWIRDLVDDGYIFHLLYLWLPTPELAVARVDQRVRTGGHDVPPETVRRRYQAGLVNFRKLYQPLSYTWRVYDASPLTGPRLAAWGRGEETVSVLNTTI